MSVDSKVPEIRFKGFSEEWEPKTLGDTISYIKGFAFKSNDYETYGVRIVRVSDLTRHSLSESSNKIYISSSKANLYSGYTINGGDIVITTVGSKAEMRESAVGRAIIFTESEGYLLNQNLVKLTPTLGNDSQFIYSQLLRERYAKFIENIQRGNANQANITIGDLWGYSLSCPKDKKEQIQIGNYFQKLDALINQHQQKHDKLSNIKKAMLEKMFPKQGKTMPEIRFKGFSGEWEISELSELALFNPKSELPESFKYVDLESVKGTSLIGYKVESRGSAPSRAQRLAQKGDVFYQTVRPYQKNNYLFHSVENDYVFSTGYAQLRPYFNGYFLLNLVQRDSFIKNVLDNCTGTSYPAINASTLATLRVSYPKNESEQTKIGSYFQKLDVLINQHQQQITKLNNIKQACLSKMFV